jgi:chromosome segregation ATPase
MTLGFGMIIESLVAVLLMATIGYCALLNHRLKKLKADEQTLKATISELITATEIAERAIAGLKLTVQECDQTLGQRLRNADAMSAEMAQQIIRGDEVVSKLAQIIVAFRPPRAEPVEPSVALNTTSTVAAATAFATRARLRAAGAAA